MNKITYACLAIVSSLTFIAQAQCNLVETIAICDMTQVDFNDDGIPDGIINLYEEYTNLTGNTIETGTWFDPGFNFVLNETTGDVFLWDLDDSSIEITDYQFQLSNTSCGDNIALTINLILGPFSGIALPTTLEDVNLEVCDMGSTPVDICVTLPDVDLFQALESLPSPHTNGEWIYEGSSPNFQEIIGSNLFVTIPYQAGPPLVDEESFELIYRVEGVAPCAEVIETSVKVSVVRQVFPGLPQNQRICERSILDGDYDDDVDLRDDAFLVYEDIEGTWAMDLYGQITDLGDSIININEIYQQIIALEPKFGCTEINFTYMVDQRSGVCSDTEVTIIFKLYEYLRSFAQDAPFEICENDPALPTTINLYDQLTFTNENGVLYDYPSDSCTQWSFISGPSNLGLIQNTGIDLCQPNALYSYLAPVNIGGAMPGTYVFEYTVYPEINCNPDSFQPFDIIDPCTTEIDDSGFCNPESAQVTIIIHPTNYAGEDTTGLEFCESTITEPIDLIALLQTNGVDDPIYVGPFGTWTEQGTGAVIANPFTVPPITGQQTFNFLYSTTTENNCIEDATLSFTIYEQYTSGTGTTIDVCNDDNAFNLYNLLTGAPSANGIWSGPNGFMSTDNSVVFDPQVSDPGVYTYTVPNNGLCTSNQAAITVNVFENANPGMDMNAVTCVSNLQVDLITLLDTQADLGGTFIDLDSSNALNGTVVDLSGLAAGFYNFEYQIQGNAICDLVSSFITLEVLDIDPPQAQDQIFCLIDGPVISDLEVSGNNAVGFNWYEDGTTTTPIPDNALLVNGEDYFVSAIDADGCESLRTVITITLRPINDENCDECFINDGISDNDDNENEVLDLCSLPVVFPNFEIEIFNRYGTIVYKGNKNTSLFDGTSNASLTIGDRLPSGVYFYVFYPKDPTTEPFQGNFYLSR